MNRKEDYTFILELPQTVIRNENMRNHIDYEKEIFERHIISGRLQLSY